MTSNDTLKRILKATVLALICGLDVIHCCSKAPEKETTEATSPAYDKTETTEATSPAYGKTETTEATSPASLNTEPLYTPYYNETYEQSPLIARAIMVEAIDSNCTQRKNESLDDYSDSNLGFFPDGALGGNAGKQKEWIPITGIMGNLTFTYNGSFVKIEGNVKGVPKGSHGFHIHEYPLSNGINMSDPTSEEYAEMYRKVQQGICRISKRHYDIDGFGTDNPLRQAENRRGHGLQNGYDANFKRTRHVGDTGNIVSTDTNGWTNIEVEDKMANMHYGHPNSILYRTVVIHQLQDFGRSPIGPRIACGIIWPVENNPRPEMPAMEPPMDACNE